HFARYTPEMVEQTCGVSREEWMQVVQTLIENTGRERTTAICYAVGWTQQSKGVQIIRCASILQLLLGNIGRPGGGIMALRGHASIQGSTDVPTLYDLLSGYMPQPSVAPTEHQQETHTIYARSQQQAGEQRRGIQQTLREYIQGSAPRTGWWAHFPEHIVSFLKAWYGDAAQPENDFCFGHVPKITD